VVTSHAPSLAASADVTGLAVLQRQVQALLRTVRNPPT
jgi:hypothetical protein